MCKPGNTGYDQDLGGHRMPHEIGIDLKMSAGYSVYL